MNLKKYIYPHELIFNQSNDTLKHNLTEYVNFNNNGVYKIRLNLSNYGKKNIIGCKNLILIFDVDSNDIIDDNQIKSLISAITFQFNGHDIEYLCDSHVILMMIKYYGLEIKQIGSKIYFPIPLSLFQNGFVPYYIDKFTLSLKINNQNIIYNKITTDVEIFYGELNFNQKYLTDYKNNYWDKMINSLNNSSNNSLNNANKSISEIIKLDNLIFFGYDFSELIELCSTFSKKNIWMNIPRNSNKVSELFFFLVNNQTNQIVTEKFFNKLEFRKSSSPEYSISYEELVYELAISQKKLSEGFYRIPFKNIYSNGLVMDDFAEYTIVIELDESINITNYDIQFYGLYDYKMNLITDTKNNNCKFNSSTNMQYCRMY
jgi:hypothetical protein